MGPSAPSATNVFGAVCLQAERRRSRSRLKAWRQCPHRRLSPSPAAPWDIPTPVPKPASTSGESEAAEMVRTAPTATIASGSAAPRMRKRRRRTRNPPRPRRLRKALLLRSWRAFLLHRGSSCLPPCLTQSSRRLASFLPWDPWAIPTAVPRPASTSAKQKAARTAPRAQIATFAAGAATEVSIRSSTCEAPGSPWSHKAPSVGGIRR
mmetsp:Transcript_29216/g.68879  ORF Transcript_29216/g.68879 Transcript_29216/m.68879 type:complete len:208 (-) Transcript_29216:53-676(-)